MNKFKEEEKERAKFTVENLDSEKDKVILVGFDISANKWYVEMDGIHMLKMSKAYKTQTS